MRKLIFLFLLYSFCQKGSSQTFTVGSTCCNYNLVNKTFTTLCSLPYILTSQDSFTIDITGDLSPDIVIKSQCMYNTGALMPNDAGIFITTPNSVESVVGPDSIVNLPFGSGYSTTLNWDTLPVSVGYSGFGPYGHKPVVYEWFYHSVNFPAYRAWGSQTNPFYVGFRKILPSSDTIYGWIRMDSNFPGKVFDYAYTCGTYTSSPPTSTITTVPTAICKGDSLVLNAIPSGGFFWGPGVSNNVFHTSSLAPGIYTVSYALPNPSGCNISRSDLTLTVNPLPTPAFTNTMTSIGFCDSLVLQANPTGGTFSGTGVSGNIFKPVSSGSVTVFYFYTNSNGCSKKASLNINVSPPPNSLTLTTSSSVFQSCPGESVILTANGAGTGTYLWNTGATSASIAVNPTVNTTYTVTGIRTSPSCSSGSTIFTQLVGNPIVTASPSLTSVCPGTNTQLNAGGAITYSWSNGANGAVCNISPTVTTTYTVVGALLGGCSDTTTVTQVVGSPIVSASVNSPSVCAGIQVTLGASGATTYLWNTGCVTGTCYDYPVSPITYSVIGYGNGGTCSDTAYVFVNVDNSNLIITVTSNDSIICAGDTAVINLSGSATGYYITSLDQSFFMTTSLSSAGITPTLTTNYVIYGNQLPSGCSATGFYTQTVTSCVGIKELKNQEDYFKIFPNPTSGEFEIKGIKEESIFILNELGQLISTKYLTKENNYSIKLDNLQNGIYFVGNKFYGQKVVVIR
jgi:hypothetical protein